MFRVYNQVGEGSEIQGWQVFTENAKQPGKKLHNIGLSGADKGIRLALDRNKYEDLTIVDAGRVFPNITAFTKLYSIHLGGDKYLPIVTAAENAEENRNIILFNYETNPGEVIADIELINVMPISHFITNKDYKSRITFAGIDIDNTKDFGVKVKYGFNGGRILHTTEVKFTNYFSVLENVKSRKGNEQVEFFNINNDHETTEKIQGNHLNIPRMDLSEVCINKK